MRLVVAGANVNFRDPVDGVMFLYKAVEGGFSKLTDLLLLISGASTETRGKRGRSPLQGGTRGSWNVCWPRAQVSTLMVDGVPLLPSTVVPTRSRRGLGSFLPTWDEGE